MASSRPPRWRTETLDEARERLTRPWGDYPLTILVFNPINLRLARWLAPTGLTPNHLTVVSFGMMLAAAAAFASTSWPVQALGGVLLWLAYLIDCLDGDLARLKELRSPLGAMLDPMLDRIGEVAIGTGAAVGGWRATGDPAWLIGGMGLVGATQVYFYLVDVLVKKLPSGGEAAPRRSLRGTPLRFGAIEPYLWGQTALALAGRAWWGVPVFGGMFALGCVGQIVRILRRAARGDDEGSERFGTHVHEQETPPDSEVGDDSAATET